MALYTCDCIDPWYIDITNNNKLICPSERITDCSYYTNPHPTFDFMVRSTKQCVNECPINYPYSFNKECFSSCENEAKSKYLYNVKKVGTSYECQCINLWNYIDPEKNKKIV